MASEVPHRWRDRRPLAADDSAPGSAPHPSLVAIPIDSYADAALCREREALARTDLRCDACDERIEGEPSGLGLFLSTRGDEVRFEEPALCASCATAIGVRATLDSEIEEEEG